jgi:hypothetical protein
MSDRLVVATGKTASAVIRDEPAPKNAGDFSIRFVKIASFRKARFRLTVSKTSIV